MEASYPDGIDADPLAVPGVDPASEDEPDVTSFILEVDGQRFAMRPDRFGGTDYTWVSGPNAGYGFSTSPTRNWSLDQHRESIRDFLAQIDPATGYIADD